MTHRIALVVPALATGGGVSTVGRFIHKVIASDPALTCRLVSLATSARDPNNLGLLQPGTWRRGCVLTPLEGQGGEAVHVGAVGGELEFQRYRRRGVLAHALADCDLVQVVCGSAAWANCVLGLGKPVSVQVATRARVERRMRQHTGRGAKALWQRGMTGITAHLEQRAMRGANAIQVENPWMHANISALVEGRAVDLRYAPPGVDATHFAPAMRRDPTEGANILWVGRIADPRKNPGMLLQAFAALPQDVRDATRLVLAGADALPHSLQQQAESLGIWPRIDYIEKPDSARLLQLYQEATAFALPSDEEGLGMVLLEAMACGIPAVATRCGGPEGVLTDGTDGYLVPRGDIAAMTSRLRHLLANTEDNLTIGCRARQTVEQRFDAPVAAMPFRETWQSLLQSRRKIA